MSQEGYIYFDGTGTGKGGLCDRLKGMFSCYVLSKKLNKQFYYNIPHPVGLKAINFQQPKDESFEELYIIDWENYLLHKNKIETLDFQSKNYKIHTNIDFTNDLNSNISFSNFINSFFNIKEFESERNIFANDVGIHVRCGGEMVPWSDYDFGVSFDENTFKDKLKNICKNPKQDVFLCSDSQKVLYIAECMRLRNLYITPHVPKHIDRGFDVNENDYVNTFYDLLTLGKSKLIYHTQGEFAKTAAKIYGNEIRSF